MTALILVCEGLAVVLVTSLELPCLISAEARRWPCQSSELSAFFAHALVGRVFLGYG